MRLTLHKDSFFFGFFFPMWHTVQGYSDPDRGIILVETCVSYCLENCI